MQPFPHRYTVTLENRHLVAPPRAPILLGPPPQFDGHDNVWSPEELLVGAALECLWTTFEAYARNAQLAIAEWSGKGIAILDRGKPVPVFTSIDLVVHVVVEVDQRERAEQLLATAKTRCIVTNALNVPVTVHATVTESPGEEQVGAASPLGRVCCAKSP